MEQGKLIVLGETQTRLFILDKRHLISDTRKFKSSSDRYYGYSVKLKPEIEEWMDENNIPFIFKGGGWSQYRLYIDDPIQAMWFKLTWM